MKKLICEVCETQMTAVCSYDSKELNPSTVEIHQCVTENCRWYSVLKHYWINKNRATYLGKTNQAESKF